MFNGDNTTQPAPTPLKIGGPPPVPWPGAGIEFKLTQHLHLLGESPDSIGIPAGFKGGKDTLSQKQADAIMELLTKEAVLAGIKVDLPSVLRCRVLLVGVASTPSGDVVTFWTDTPTPRMLWPSDLLAVYDGPVCVWRRE